MHLPILMTYIIHGLLIIVSLKMRILMGTVSSKPSGKPKMCVV